MAGKLSNKDGAFGSAGSQKTTRAKTTATEATVRKTLGGVKSGIKALAPSNVYHIERSNNATGSLSQYKMPEGLVTMESMIPAPVMDIMRQQFNDLGLPFEIDNMVVRGDRDNLEAFKQTRAAVQMIVNNAKLLPEWVKLVKKALAANVKSHKAKSEIAQEALISQGKIDKEHAKVLTAMMGLEKTRHKIRVKLENKVKELDAVKAGQERYFNESYGAALQTLEAKNQIAIRAAQESQKTKVTVAESKAAAKQETEEYIRAAMS